MGARSGNRVHRGAGKFYRALRDDLVAFAGAYFRLNARAPGDGDGTVADGLGDAADFYDDDAIEEQIELPDLPIETVELWAAFRRLSARRPQGFGPGAITYEAIAAFERHMGCAFTPWEVETLEELDGAWLIAAAEQRKANTPGAVPDAGR